jgi:hypothetical protein
MTFEYTLKREGGEIEVTVHGDYHRASRGYRDSLGVPEEPDEPSCFEIDTVTDSDGNEVEVSDHELDILAERGVAVCESGWD